MRGSPMGIGSDLGGSIRSPSCYNGIYGLRPSHGRIPYHRILNSMEGQETIPSVVGPMSQTAADLALFTKIVLESKPWLDDPKCHPLPWKDSVYQQYSSPGKKLRIGLMDWDGVILPQPPIRRALKVADKKLSAAGHTIIPWRIDQKKALELVLRTFTSDANADLDRTIALSGEPALAQITHTEKPPLTINQSWALAMERLDFQASVLKQWKETASSFGDGEPMDVYIAPVNPSVCPKHGDYEKVRYIAYTATGNLLDLTAVTVPVSRVDATIDVKDRSETEDAAGSGIPPPTGDLDRVIRKRYDGNIYKGLPVGLQVVGRRLEEEKVLAISQMVGELLAEPKS